MKRIFAIILVAMFGIISISAQNKVIGMKRAKQIALARVNGKIKSSELENEKGTKVYSFDVRRAKGGITEVLVNAYTGKIIEVKDESAEDEAKEAREDSKRKN